MTLNTDLVTNIQLYITEYISLIVMTQQYSSKHNLHVSPTYQTSFQQLCKSVRGGISLAVAERRVLTDLRLWRTVLLKVMHFFASKSHDVFVKIQILYPHSRSTELDSQEFRIRKMHFFSNFNFFLTPKTFCTGVQLINNVIVSSEQRRDSAIHIHVSILPQTPAAIQLAHNIEQTEFHVLYNRSLLVIHFKYSSVYMPFPNSLSSPSPWQPLSSFSKSVSFRKIHF